MDSFRKGRIAERIVADLFREAGFEVYKYGYEHTVPKLAKRRPIIQGKIAQYIRHMPDFIVVNKHDEAFFVEVKYRSNSIIPKEEMYPYPDCIIVFLTKNYIYAQSVKKIHSKTRMKFEWLTNMYPFQHMDKKIIWKYVLKLRRTLGDENLIGQLMQRLMEKIAGKKFRSPPPETIIVTKT